MHQAREINCVARAYLDFVTLYFRLRSARPDFFLHFYEFMIFLIISFIFGAQYRSSSSLKWEKEGQMKVEQEVFDKMY